MALFESYERREKQILAVIKEYGIRFPPRLRKFPPPEATEKYFLPAL